MQIVVGKRRLSPCWHQIARKLQHLLMGRRSLLPAGGFSAVDSRKLTVASVKWPEIAPGLQPDCFRSDPDAALGREIHSGVARVPCPTPSGRPRGAFGLDCMAWLRRGPRHSATVAPRVSSRLRPIRRTLCRCNRRRSCRDDVVDSAGSRISCKELSEM